jgi:hypothetical protein
LTCALVDVVSPATDPVIWPLSVRLKQTREFASLNQPHRIAAPHDASTKPGNADNVVLKKTQPNTDQVSALSVPPFLIPFFGFLFADSRENPSF